MNKKSLGVAVSRLALCCAFAGPPSAVLAQASQTPPPPASQPPVVAASSGVPDVLVTARKRAESLQSVPVAETAFGAQALRQKNIQGFYDLMPNTPGLLVRTAGGQRNDPDFFIRGQGSTFGSAPGVVSYFAGAPSFISPNLGADIQFYDLSSVQVLKGPQGTLFGKSTTGGAVLVDPQRPTNRFGGYIDLSAGNYNMGEINGALNIPIIPDVLSLRLAGDIDHRDGFTRSLTTGQRLDGRNRDSYRVGLLFTPNDTFKNYTLFYGENIDESAGSSILLEYNPNFPLFNPNTSLTTTTGGDEIGFICSLTTLPANVPACIASRTGKLNALNAAYQAETARLAAGGPGAVRSTPTAFNDFTRGQVQTLLNETTIEAGSVPYLGHLTLKNIFSTSRTIGGASTREIAGSPFPNGDPINGQQLINGAPTVTGQSGTTNFFDEYTEEVQLAGQTSRVNWLVGYYREQNNQPLSYPPLFPSFNDALDFPPFGEFATVGAFQINSRELDQGVFGQATIRLLDNLNFTGGYRQSSAHQTSFNAPAILVGPNMVEVPDLSNLVQAPTRNENAGSYNLTLDYKPFSDLLLYVANRRGYKPGGTNVVPNPLPPGAVVLFQPEYVTDVEVGAKYDWRMDGVSGRSNLAVYNDWYSNIQRTQVLPAGVGSVFTQTANIAAAVLTGLEFENTLQFGDRWTVTLNYAYIDAHYTKYPGTTINSLGVTVPLIDSPYIGTPHHSGTIGLRYLAVSSPDIGDISLSGDLYMQTDVYLDDFEAQDARQVGHQSGYQNLNLRLDWQHMFGRPIDGSIFVRNAIDNTHLIGVNSLIASLGVITGIYDEPRTFGVELHYRFGS